MAEKIGAGGELQQYSTDNGRYGENTVISKDKSNKSLIPNTDDIPKIEKAIDDLGQKQSGHREIPSGTTKEKFVSKELDISEEKAKEYVNSIETYADAKYKEIRDCQKTGRGSPEIFKAIKDLESYIEKAPKWNNGETFRGVRLSNEDLSKWERKDFVGDMQGLSSWSSESIIAEEFAEGDPNDITRLDKPNKVIFHSATQQKGTSIRHLSHYPGDEGENEVLVSSSTKYKVKDTKKSKDGFIHIFLEEE